MCCDKHDVIRVKAGLYDVYNNGIKIGYIERDVENKWTFYNEAMNVFFMEESLKEAKISVHYFGARR